MGAWPQPFISTPSGAGDAGYQLLAVAASEDAVAVAVDDKGGELNVTEPHKRVAGQ